MRLGSFRKKQLLAFGDWLLAGVELGSFCIKQLLAFGDWLLAGLELGSFRIFCVVVGSPAGRAGLNA